MNKKLLSVAIGTLLAGSIGVAQADVQLYGQLDTSIDSHDCDNDCYWDFESDTDDITMNSNYTYLGVKGSEDLGNGLKAIFNAKFQFDGAEGGSSLWNDESWLGLEGGFGTVRAGVVHTLYRDHGAMIDPFYGTSLDGTAGGLQSWLHSYEWTDEDADGNSDHTLRYDSVDMNGLSFGGFYTFDSYKGDGEDEDPYGVGVSYKNGNILGFLDYQTDATDDCYDGDECSAWKIGGSYTMGNIAFYGQYETGALVDYYDDASMWHLGGSFTMGNTMAYLAYGQADDSEDYEHSAWTLAVKHSLSQRTSVYAGFNQVDEDNGDGETDHFALGMNLKF